MSGILTDVIPPKARKYVYAVLTLAGIAFAAWNASEGDWTEFATYILGSLGFGMATSNTPARPTSEPFGLAREWKRTTGDRKADAAYHDGTER